jgi:serine/threonine protein kinase/Tol biopolymer transport system component
MMLTKDLRLGPYEIQAPLGQGGMGEVYRAIDTRLGRAVAIKILPRHVGDSPTRRQRFEREARALSSLSHPHICPLYDIGEQDGLPFLVMEALDGETLAERLVRGALPIDQVLRYAIEIADALDHAHRQGVIHRDLKPSNIMLTRSGVKLLDFGVARLCATDTIAGASLLEMPAVQTITDEGTLVGTPQYMAPEQLEGRAADARTDIFAFGAVVHEMATGRQAFEGRSRAAVIAAILEHDPEAVSSARRTGTESTVTASARDTVPPLLDQVIARCLAKDPGERWQTANDLEQALKWIAEGPAETVRTPQRTSRRAQLAWVVAVGLAGALGAIGVWSVTSRAPSVPGAVSRFALSIPETDTFMSYGLAFSPNGRNLVYVGSRHGTQQLFRHALDQLEAVPIAGTEGAFFPFFSPDGQWIGFFADNALKKVAAGGGTAVTICPAGFRYGASWGRDGRIVFASGSSPDLMQVAATGGAPKPLTTMATGKRARWPELTPDGRAVLYTVFSGWVETARVVVRSLDTGTERELVDGTNPRLSPTGHLVFGRPGELWAAPFDRDRLAITGAPTPVAEGVQVNSGGLALFAVASDGSLVHATPPRSIVVTLDRAGRADVLLDVPRVYYEVPQPSPDGHRLAMAFSDHVGFNPAIWTYDLERRLPSRLTFERSFVGSPLWTPDGQRIVFWSDRAGGERNLFWTAADGSGVAEQLTSSPNSQVPSSWTRDGRLLAFTERDNRTTYDLWTLRVDSAHKPEPFLRTPHLELEAQFSPDGRWMAYQSTESGQGLAIYVRPFPPAGGEWQVSTRGGTTPRWSPDGKELFYLADDTLMVAAVTPGPTFQAAAPRALFRHTESPDYFGKLSFAVMPDGQHFLMLQPAGAPFQIQVTLNWVEELKARVPTR